MNLGKDLVGMKHKPVESGVAEDGSEYAEERERVVWGAGAKGMQGEEGGKGGGAGEATDLMVAASGNTTPLKLSGSTRARKYVWSFLRSSAGDSSGGRDTSAGWCRLA
jgi:hypothetical protein